MSFLAAEVISWMPILILTTTGCLQCDSFSIVCMFALYKTFFFF